MYNDLIALHTKILNNNYTYEDASAYILIFETINLNRRTMTMAVEVLSDELPDNFLESLAMSGSSAARILLNELFFDEIFGGIKIEDEVVFNRIVENYAEYLCGNGDNFFNNMRDLKNPAITEWINYVEEFDSSIAQKLGQNR